MLLRLDVSRCNKKKRVIFLRFCLLDLSVLTPVILVPSTLWSQWIYHNTGMYQQFERVFFEYFHPILQLVISLIASDCFPHIWIVARGMVITVVFWVFRVEIM